jgi:hypothetical protein
MRVRTREHVRNEGSRRFKSVPLRQPVCRFHLHFGGGGNSARKWSSFLNSYASALRSSTGERARVLNAAIGYEQKRLQCQKSVHPKIGHAPIEVTSSRGTVTTTRVFGSALGPTGARRCSSGRGSSFGKIGSRRTPIPPRTWSNCFKLKAATVLVGKRARRNQLTGSAVPGDFG